MNVFCSTSSPVGHVYGQVRPKSTRICSRLFHKAEPIGPVLTSPTLIDKSWIYKFLNGWLGTGLLTRHLIDCEIFSSVEERIRCLWTIFVIHIQYFHRGCDTHFRTVFFLCISFSGLLMKPNEPLSSAQSFVTVVSA